MTITVEEYLNHIAEEDKNLFLSQLSYKPLSAGEHYVREGQHVHTIAYIREGFMRTYQIDYQGNDITLEFHRPDSFCGSYYGFYARQAAMDNLEAITDCTIGTITFDQLMSLYEKNLQINILGRMLIEQVCIAKDFRIAKMLQSNAEERYRWFMESFPDILQVAQLQHIASYLGIKPETLSRVRKKLTS